MPPIDRAALAECESPVAQPFSSREFRDAMGRFATGVVVISTEHDGDAHAMTANAFMSGSLAPPLVLVSVACTARMHERIQAAGRFAVSVLADGQLAVSNHFAGKRDDAFAPAFARLGELPVIAGAAMQLAADLRHAYPCGDHTLFVGEVTALHSETARDPLLYHGGRYGRLTA